MNQVNPSSIIIEFRYEAGPNDEKMSSLKNGAGFLIKQDPAPFLEFRYGAGPNDEKMSLLETARRKSQLRFFFGYLIKK